MRERSDLPRLPQTYDATPLPTQPDRLLTIAELADLLQLSERTIRRMVAAQRIPCLRVGRQIRFLPSDLLRWVSARKEA